MWKQQIVNYVPMNEQEQADLRVMKRAIETFEDVLTRDNELVHVTVSGFVVNEARQKVLMIHHNIYHAWGWTGGHADGETDLLAVAIREVQEETGVQAQAVTEEIFSIDVLQVLPHYKNGQYVTPHVHLNVTYLLQADEAQTLTVAEEENSAVAWIPFSDVSEKCNEAHMIPIYEKLIQKVQQRIDPA